MQALILEFSCWVEFEPAQEQAMIEKVRQAIVASGHVILGKTDHVFEPQGYTVVWALAESHLAIHTYPEHGTAYLQLSSCSKPKYELFIQELGALGYPLFNIVKNTTKAPLQE